ncbi:MAG: ribonuclease HI [Ruminococcaceae bacterium]|nr:ribonuclease HI [Oscillospiraceae bacterium]
MQGTEKKHVTMYTDGACSGNPGPGGWGTILCYGAHRLELSGGYRLTTNNRMEIYAVLSGLKRLKESCIVDVYSDSKYVVDAVNQGWVYGWKKKNWIKSNKEKAQNPDLWQALLDEMQRHDVTFHWVKGHDGHPENERCDEMAVAAYNGDNLAEDTGYIPSV